MRSNHHETGMVMQPGHRHLPRRERIIPDAKQSERRLLLVDGTLSRAEPLAMRIQVFPRARGSRLNRTGMIADALLGSDLHPSWHTATVGKIGALQERIQVLRLDQYRIPKLVAQYSPLIQLQFHHRSAIVLHTRPPLIWTQALQVLELAVGLDVTHEILPGQPHSANRRGSLKTLDHRRPGRPRPAPRLGRPRRAQPGHEQARIY